MSLGLSKTCQAIAPSVTLKMNALVTEMRERGEDVISLSVGEPDFITPRHIREAGKKAIDEGKTKYTAASGMPALRKAIAADLLRQKGLKYTREEIIVGNGAKQVILGALQSILNTGDEVILPAPCLVSYPEMVGMAGGKAVWVNTTREQGFVPTRKQLERAITPRTKALILNSPSNPTGAVWTEEQLKTLADLAVRHQFYVISDEIYEKLVYDGARHISIASLGHDIFNQTIVVSGFSKAYAMTGWRLGYAAGPRPVIAAMSAFQSHATGNPNSIAQYAGLAALQGDQTCVEEMTEAFSKRRMLMLGCLSHVPLVSTFTPKGAFYVLLDIRQTIGLSLNGKIIHDSLDFAELLLKNARVSVVPGDSFGAPGYVRLSYAISDERILEAVRRIGNFTDRLCASRMSA
ncbi:MAG: pyridoxal phosphate-dependent aminotransferase [Clostridia bacterium]|nr:pyridoxal phosphate-dependent aminotransferase [Clostridia bacterium]